MMENSFFVLSDGDNTTTIERFHICTWDFTDKNSFIELGFEIDNSNSDRDNINLTFAAPFLKNVTEGNITCLADRLRIRENSKFIFNDTVPNSKAIADDDRNGTTLYFEGRDALTILPIEKKEIDQQNGALSLTLKVPTDATDKMYFRILIALPHKTIAIPKDSFSKTMYIFDIKVNEKRNLPDEVFRLMKKNRLSLCTIKRCFCFHIIPNTLEISFIDDKKLENIRELEYSAFKKYLPDKVTGLKQEEHMIIFLKDADKEAHKDTDKDAKKNTSYIFFSTFTKERLGSKQIFFTLAANILCSTLLAFTFDDKHNFSDLKSIPWNLIILILISLCLVIYIIILFINQARR